MGAAPQINPWEDRSFKPERSPAGENPHKVRSELCTDLNAAREFLSYSRSFVLWCAALGWLYWDGTRWVADNIDKIKSMAQRLGAHFRDTAKEYDDPEIAKGIYQFARYCESSRGVEAILKMARPEVAIGVSELDRNPMLVNFQNKTIDLSREHPLTIPLDHAQADFNTKLVPCDYHMGAACPTWKKHLERVVPDPETRHFFHKYIGYAMTGDTSDQSFVVAWGSGRNGKSVTFNAIMRALGPDYAAAADASTFSADRRNGGPTNDIADLRGIRFVLCQETGDGHRLDETFIKSATGGDPIRARHLYQENFTFRAEFKLFLVTNHKPVIRGTDYAIWRRVRLIPFTETIGDDECDPHLERKLANEAEGILYWALEGAELWRAEGLKPPPQVLAATDAYRTEQDILGQFLADCTETDPHGEVGRKELFEAYVRWCEAEGERAVSNTKFSRWVAERGFDGHKTRAGRVWIGVRLT